MNSQLASISVPRFNSVFMNLIQELQHAQLSRTTRRLFLQECAAGLGAAWLASAAGIVLGATSTPAVRDAARPLAPLMPPLPAKAKRVIYLHMAGSPSQLDLFDYKPDLHKLDGRDCPQEFLAGRRFAFIRGVPKLLGPQFPFKQHGESGAWLSDRLPHLSSVVD